MKKSILIVPCCEEGKGGGHLTRCISLANDLRSLGRETRIFITPQTRDLTSLYKSMNFNPSFCITNEELIIRNENLKETFEFIILDRFQTPLEEIERWKKIAPVIGIDEGGKYRDRFDFLIDILPNTEKKVANIQDPSLLKLPKKILAADNKNHQTPNTETKKIKTLITFGHEDSAGLGLAVLNALSSDYYDDMEITYIRGGLCKSDSSLKELFYKNIKILEVIPNLSEHLHEYDLVITHFGITAFEALYADTSVLLVNPTNYHRKIAKLSGFISIPTLHCKSYISVKMRCLNKNNFLSNLKNHCKRLTNKYRLNKESTNLAQLINNFSPVVTRHCPVCSFSAPSFCIARFSDRTYRRCSKCGIIYMDRINSSPIEYKAEYFFDSYIKQYGKTYIDDFPNLKEMAKRRLKVIKSLMPSNKNSKHHPTLLDIGCAYGPFLLAAKEEGFIPVGIDPAEDAVRYVKNELGISAFHGFFPYTSAVSQQDTQPVIDSYNVITLWFVIEHFIDCVSVLAEIRKLLKDGGLLAFSTPSFSGISGRKNLCRFLENSPADHFTIWSPKMCKKALALTGYKVIKTKNVGHHPERFPVFGKFIKCKKGILFFILLAISKIFNLGDTFEVFAVKH